MKNRTMPRRRPITVGVLAASVMLAACGTNSANPGSPSSSATPSSHGNHVTIGIVLLSGTDVTTLGAVTGAEQVGKQKGWKFDEIDANGSPAQANAAIQDFVAKKVNGIIVTVFTPNELGTGLAAASAAHIPVVSVAGGLGAGVSEDIAANDGTPIATLLATTLKSGSVLEFTYHPGAPCLAREQSMDQVLKSYPAISVTKFEIPIPGAQQAGETETTAWLEAHPSGKLAIWGCYDDPAIGAISAITQAHRSGVDVYGFNGSPPALQAIGTGTMTASLAVDPVGIGKQAIAGFQKIFAAGSSWKPTTVQASFTIVTSSNLAQYLAANPGAENG